MIDFAPHVNTMFLQLGRPAVYTPAGGDPVNVRVIPHQSDEIDDGSGVPRIAQTTLFDVRRSEIAEPKKEDAILLDGETYTVISGPVSRDADRLIWTLSVRQE